MAAGVIQGQIAHSKNEINLAMAFDTLKIDYIYHYVIFGTRGIRGAIEVDFVIKPFNIPVELFGEHYHDMTTEDRFKLAREYQYFKFETIIFWGRETETYELALKAAREKL